MLDISSSHDVFFTNGQICNFSISYGSRRNTAVTFCRSLMGSYSILIGEGGMLSWPQSLLSNQI